MSRLPKQLSTKTGEAHRASDQDRDVGPTPPGSARPRHQEIPVAEPDVYGPGEDSVDGGRRSVQHAAGHGMPRGLGLV